MKQTAQEGQKQGQGKRAERGPFPLVKVLIIFLVLLVLSALVAAGLLANTHNNTIWIFLAHALISLISALVPVLQWLFPISPDKAVPVPLPASQAMSGQIGPVLPAQVQAVPESTHVNEQHLRDPGASTKTVHEQ